MAYGIIYVITNTVNGKQYVGQTTYTLKIRWGWPLKPGREESSCLIDRAIRKYGPESFTIEQIDTAESLSELDGKEVYHVARLGTYRDGYNLTIGGGGNTGWVPSEETRKKLSEAGKGRVRSAESRLRQSESMRGHLVSKETCRKQSEANTRRWASKENCQKQSEALLGRAISKETRQKISESLQGRKHPLKQSCKYGHVYNEVNTYIVPSTGGRRCLLCFYLYTGRKLPENLRKYVEELT